MGLHWGEKICWVLFGWGNTLAFEVQGVVGVQVVFNRA